MKTIVIIMAVILFLFGVLSIASAQGEGEDTANNSNLYICCPVIGILLLIMAGATGIAKNNTKRDGIAYIIFSHKNYSSAYIKRVDDGRLSKEPDNRKKTGYW